MATERPLEEPLLVQDEGEAQAQPDGLQLQTHRSNDSVQASQDPPTSAHLLPSAPSPNADNGNNNNNVENEEETRRQQNNRLNESYKMLSPFQGALLATGLLHGVSFHMLSHLGAFHTYILHFGGHFHFTLVTDFIRILICLAVETYDKGGDLRQSLRLNFLHHPKDALKMAVPVVLQFAQTLALKQVATDLDLVFTEFAYYGILVGIALFSVLLLQYSYTRKQWVCLTLAFLGCTLATWANVGQPEDRHFLDGIVFAILSLGCGAMALVYMEIVLKQDLRLLRADPPPASIWVRGLQFSIFSAVLNMFKGGLSSSGDSALLNGWTWFFAPAWAAGPLLTLLVVKFVTALHSKLVVYLTMTLSMLINLWFFGFKPFGVFRWYLGSLVVVVAIFFFGMDLPRPEDFSSYARVAVSPHSHATPNVPSTTLTPGV